MNRSRLSKAFFGSMLCSIVAAASIFCPPTSAQTVVAPVAVVPAANPSTRILAIGTVNASATADELQFLLPLEVRETVKLYLAGKIDQWYAFPDRSGVVFLLNVQTISQARAMLDSLPFGQAKFMDFRLIAVAPLSPLALLINAEPGPNQWKSVP